MSQPETMDQKQLDDLAVENFRKYLRIRSVHPKPDYASCVEFLRTVADSIGLDFSVVELVVGKPVVVMKWEGTEPQEAAIMLNSHMDVVPVREELWTHDPFAAEIDEEGRIFARGSQDTKNLAILHMESVRRLKIAGVKLRRNVIVTMVPDEEIGSAEGMEIFSQSEEFRKLNVGFEFDESVASPESKYLVFNSERSVWRPHIRCWGMTGHGSQLEAGTPGEKMRVVLDRFMDFRQEELDKLIKDPHAWPGHVTSTNLTIIEGGSQANVIPPEFSLFFDMRVTPSMDFDELEENMRKWCAEAGDRVDLVFLRKEPKNPITELGADNKWWTAFKKATDKLGMEIFADICPGTTDARHIRKLGIPALGFSAVNNTPILQHGNDEFLRVDSLLQGIEIFQEVLKEVANVE